MKVLVNLRKPRSFSTPPPFTKPHTQKPLTIFSSHQSTSPNSPNSMSQQHSNSSSMKQELNTQIQQNDPSMSDYPTPLSPPLPAISKDIELNRAMSASSNSSLFLLSKDDIIFQDQWLFVVNKPSGVYCETLLSSAPALIQQPADSTGPLEFHLANRLDRDTSGVMVITKLHKAAAKLVKAFTDHKVHKTYIALCVGITPKWSKIRLKSGHGRSKYGAWRVYSSLDVGRNLPGGSFVRDMETLFEVISINGETPLEATYEGKDNEENVAVVVEEKPLIEVKHRDEVVVRAFPRSGRTHQIRLHCQYLGMPIKGDVKYEGVYEWKGETCVGHALHAESLSFEHPITGVPLKFQAPLPCWAAQAMGL
ncbi:hypothetical protein KSS87_008644 [Heliosperma pusillum]|nr:hypothetical protein KSS87_013961 [Heliosperma pusillum]KAH9622754.1 hypothetical protein KSS87_008644 [Heliosperma pusillum]